jgi:hypothetical protein
MSMITLEKSDIGTDIYRWWIAGMQIDSWEIKPGEKVEMDSADGKVLVRFLAQGKTYTWSSQLFKVINNAETTS